MIARKSQDWSMYRGDTLSFNVEIEDLKEDLSSIYFSCKPMMDDYYIFQKSLANGCQKLETGKYNVHVSPEDTQNVDPGTYRMDLQIEIGADRYTVMKGTLKIVDDVTR